MAVEPVPHPLAELFPLIQGDDFDALVAHGGVQELMADQVLVAIAHDLVDAIRSSGTIDWTQKEAVRADMRRKVKKLLRKHGYPPDKQAEAVVTVLEQAETLCKDWAENAPAAATTAAAPAGKVVPFRRVAAAEVKPFVNSVPVYDLKIAAGRFGAEQTVEEVPQVGEVSNPEDFEWVALNGRTKPAPGLFVAQVVGESMNKRIPNGAWCLWRLNPAGSRQGKVVLAMHRDVHDSELGGQFTVKLYESEKEDLGDGPWQHTRVVLGPSSTDPRFRPIVLEGTVEGELVVVAEMIEVLK